MDVCVQTEGYVKDGFKEDMAQVQYSVVPNYTAAMLDLSSSLLSETVHFSKQMIGMETQVRW